MSPIRSLPILIVLLAAISVSFNVPRAHAFGLRDVRLWAYQIQNQELDGNLQKLAESHYDMLVVDDTRSIAGLTSYDMKAFVTLLHSSLGSSGQPKLVLAYMDIGEAENYRWYWQSGWAVGNPDWIVAIDPDGWAGNYPIKFWRPAWRNILFGSASSYLDMVLADGFDGIYLDWVEAATFQPVAQAASAEKLDPRAEMINLVSQLAAYARAQKPGFLVIPQNALDLAQPNDSVTRQYVSTISGIGQESIWFDGTSQEVQGDIPSNYTDEALSDIQVFQSAGKPVFTIDYAQQPEHVAYAYQQAALHGFIEYVTLRQLDQLSATPPPTYPVAEFERGVAIFMVLAITEAVFISRLHAPRKRRKTRD